MKRMLLVTLAILVACLVMGCVNDLSLGLDTPDFPVPDVTRSWVVSVSEAHPHRLQADSAAGACTVDDFQFTLAAAGSVTESSGERLLYSGSHTAIKMVCAGVSRSATEVFGLMDTVVVVPVGSITGEMGPPICGGFFTPCVPPATWLFHLEASGFLFSTTGHHARLIGSFHWTDALDSIRVQGRWSAHR